LALGMGCAFGPVDFEVTVAPCHSSDVDDVVPLV